MPNRRVLCWMADRTGSIYWYNQAWYDYTGTTWDEMKGWGWTAVHDPSRLSDVLASWVAAVTDQRSWEMVFPIKGGDGVFRDFRTTAEPVKVHGELRFWFGTNTDVAVWPDHPPAPEPGP